MESVRYNVLSDGDRHLRGKLAEMVFERIKDRLLQKLTLCSTYDLKWMLVELHYSEVDLEEILDKLKMIKDTCNRYWIRLRKRSFGTNIMSTIFTIFTLDLKSTNIL